MQGINCGNNLDTMKITQITEEWGDYAKKRVKRERDTRALESRQTAK